MSEARRPRLHLTAGGWLNDPNGPIFHQGQYHLFAQHNPDGLDHRNIHWAHWTSRDLVRWKQQPIALRPTAGGPDRSGCWSGSAIVDDGEIALIYSGHDETRSTESVIVARRPPTSQEWTDKHAVKLSLGTAPRLRVLRDPYAWRDEVGWRAIIGAGSDDGLPMALSFRMDTLEAWRYDGVACHGRSGILSSEDVGAGWECPQLWDRGDRALLVVSDWRPPSTLMGCRWIAGRWDGAHLVPEGTGPVDHGPSAYAADLLVENDRALMWAWLRDPAGGDATQGDWAGMLTVAREVRFDDGAPEIMPARELDAVRAGTARQRAAEVDGPESVVLDRDVGQSIDMDAELSHPGSFVRVADQDPRQYVQITWSVDGSRLDVRHVHPADGHSGAPPTSIPLTPHVAEPLRLRVIADVSVVEVFVSGKAAALRIAPTGRTAELIVGGVRGTVSCRWWDIRESMID